MRAACALPVLLAFLLSAGCQPRDPARAMLQEYAYRVANVLDAEISEPQAPDILQTLPPRRERQLQTADLRIGLFEYLELKACDMRHLVSQRNSVLGRVMPPSRQLVYEARLLTALDTCHRYLQQHPPEDSEFADLISEARAQKRGELPKVVWNASFASEELERSLSLGNGHLQPGTEHLLHESTRELRWFTETMHNVLEQAQIPDIGELESHYQSLAFNPAPGQLFQSMALAIQWLEFVNQTLRQSDLRRLCPQEIPTRKARILQTVFAKFYAGEVQTWLSMLHRAGGEWRRAMEQLIEVQRLELPPAFSRYARVMLDSRQPNSLWVRFDAAMQAHTGNWQRVLGHCGMMPSAQTLRESAARQLP